MKSSKKSAHNGVSRCDDARDEWHGSMPNGESDDELKITHIIILTAKGQEMDKKQGESVGANLYMTKPFNPKQIFALAMKILEIEE